MPRKVKLDGSGQRGKIGAADRGVNGEAEAGGAGAPREIGEEGHAPFCHR